MTFVAVFYGLTLAHFIADYMQPASLVAWTKRNGGGLYVHIAIYASLTALVLAGSGSLWIPALAVLTISHLAFDKVKYRLSGRRQGRHLTWFLLDQAGHGVTIVIVAALVGAQSGPTGWCVKLITDNLDMTVLIAALIAASFGGSILVFEAARTLAPDNDGRVVTLKERLPGMVERAFASLILFAAPWPWKLLSPLAFTYSGAGVLNSRRNQERHRTGVEFAASVASFLMAAALFYAKGFI